jgi:hypothetical protein
MGGQNYLKNFEMSFYKYVKTYLDFMTRQDISNLALVIIKFNYQNTIQ